MLQHLSIVSLLLSVHLPLCPSSFHNLSVQLPICLSVPVTCLSRSAVLVTREISLTSLVFHTAKNSHALSIVESDRYH